MIDETLFDAEEKMEKAVQVVKDDLATLRTGRANPNMFARIVIDYYGAPTPLTQMATINMPEARMAVIKPYDMSQLQAIEKAIRDSDLGVNPGNDGIVLRVVFPQLTEERRRELGKTARSKGEDAKVAIRNIRRKAKDTLDKMSRTARSVRTRSARAEKELQSITDRYVARSTRWSSTRKPSCSRSDERAAPAGRTSPSRAGRNLPMAIARRRSASARLVIAQPADLPAGVRRRSSLPRWPPRSGSCAARSRGPAASPQLDPDAGRRCATIGLAWPYGRPRRASASR